MRARMVISSGWIYLALSAAAVPTGLIILFLAAGDLSVALELAVIFAIFAGVMALGAYTALSKGSVDREPMPTEHEKSGIAWIDEVPFAPLAPVSMRAVKVTGACAFGFMPGNEWVIDADGHLSRPLCAAAAKAFSSLRDSPWENGFPQEIACQCPLADREVVFSMDAAAEDDYDYGVPT